jgi:hypothetical protein
MYGLVKLLGIKLFVRSDYLLCQDFTLFVSIVRIVVPVLSFCKIPVRKSAAVV